MDFGHFIDTKRKFAIFWSFLQLVRFLTVLFLQGGNHEEIHYLRDGSIRLESAGNWKPSFKSGGSKSSAVR